MGLLNTARRLLFVAGVTLAGMCAASVGVNLIPNDRLLSHVRSSLPPANFPPSQFGEGIVDFWDDCTAATVGLGHGAEQLSLVARSFLSPVIGNCQEFQKYINGEKWIPFSESLYQVQTAGLAAGGNSLRGPSASATNLGFNYWRYWHGYQILSRPLLYGYDLGTVHYVLFGLVLLSGVFFASQVSRFSRSCMWSLVVAFLCVPAVNQIAVLSHSMVWIIAFSIGGWLLLPSTSAHERRDPHVWFFVIGMLCCFFDLFTVPLVTLTVPLLGLYWNGEFEAGSPKLTVRRICMLSALWLAGYCICWATKWAIVGMIGGTEVITELSNVIKHRLGIGGQLGDNGQQLSVSAALSILDNAWVCRHGLLIVAVLAVARIRPLAAAMLSNKKWSFSAAAVPLVLFGMPMVWLAVVEQHSIYHAWFVARIYFSSFAIVLAFIFRRRDPAGLTGRQPVITEDFSIAANSLSVS